MKLSQFNNSGFDRGRPFLVEAAWQVMEGLFFGSWLPGSGWRVRLLRLFGSRVAEGVVIKPRVRVKFPWRLSIGSDSWIGEGVWIDNLADVSIGRDSCISQGAYLCTGSHRWDRDSFDLEIRPIRIDSECWVGAMAKLAPGTVMEEGTVLTLGSLGVGTLKQWSVYSGTPASRVRKREER